MKKIALCALTSVFLLGSAYATENRDSSDQLPVVQCQAVINELKDVIIKEATPALFTASGAHSQSMTPWVKASRDWLSAVVSLSEDEVIKFNSSKAACTKGWLGEFQENTDFIQKKSDWLKQAMN